MFLNAFQLWIIWHLSSLHAWALVFRCSIITVWTYLPFLLCVVGSQLSSLWLAYVFAFHDASQSFDSMTQYDMISTGVEWAERLFRKHEWQTGPVLPLESIVFFSVPSNDRQWVHVALAPIIKQAIKQHCHPMSLPLVPPKRWLFAFAWASLKIFSSESGGME